MRLLILSFFILMLAACSNAQPIDEPEPETAEEETDQENSAENDEVSESEEKPSVH